MKWVYSAQVGSRPLKAMTYKSITCIELRDWLATGERPVLLDVREDEEREISTISGDVHIPMNDVPFRVDELDPQKPIVVYCKGGVRSARIAEFLVAKGFPDVTNLEGGINEWARSVDQSLPVY